MGNIFDDFFLDMFLSAAESDDSGASPSFSLFLPEILDSDSTSKESFSPEVLDFNDCLNGFVQTPYGTDLVSSSDTSVSTTDLGTLSPSIIDLSTFEENRFFTTVY
jgi:hypothetical protein